MTSNHYIRSDGNGGISISHSLALVTIIIMLIIATVPYVLSLGGLKQEVVDIRIDFNDYQEYTMSRGQALRDDLTDTNLKVKELDTKIDIVLTNQVEMKELLKRK